MSRWGHDVYVADVPNVCPGAGKTCGGVIVVEQTFHKELTANGTTKRLCYAHCACSDCVTHWHETAEDALAAFARGEFITAKEALEDANSERCRRCYRGALRLCGGVAAKCDIAAKDKARRKEEAARLREVAALVGLERAAARREGKKRARAAAKKWEAKRGTARR